MSFGFNPAGGGICHMLLQAHEVSAVLIGLIFQYVQNLFIRYLDKINLVGLAGLPIDLHMGIQPVRLEAHIPEHRPLFFIRLPNLPEPGLNFPSGFVSYCTLTLQTGRTDKNNNRQNHILNRYPTSAHDKSSLQ